MKKLPTLIVVALCNFATTQAQSWKWVAKSSFSTFVANIECSQLAVDKTGNVYVSGTTLEYHPGFLQGLTTKFGTYSVYDSSAVGQMIIAKVNPSGTFQWAKGSQLSDAMTIKMVIDKAGNLYVFGIYNMSSFRMGGITLSNTGSDMMYFLMKFDPLGNVLWLKNVAPTHGLVFYNEILTHGSMGIDDADNIYLSGEFNQSSISIGTFTLSNSSGQNEIFVARYNTAGTPTLARCYANVNDYVSGIAVTGRGDFYIAGTYTSTSVSFGAYSGSNGNFIAKFDTNGTPQWVKSAGSALQQVNGVATDNAGNVYMTGGYRTASTSFGAQTLTNMNAGKDDVFLVKYDSLGNVLWAKSAGTPDYDDGYAITTDACGNVFLCGTMGLNTSTLTPHYNMKFGTDSISGTANLVDDPLFIARYDASGNYVSGMVLASGGDDMAGLQVDKMGNFYLAGDWYQTTGTIGSNTMTSDSGAEYLFVAKYFYDVQHCLPSSVQEQTTATLGFTLSPNPATGEVTIEMPGNNGNATAEIYDINGKLLQTVSLKNGHTKISLNQMTSGIYLCRILTETGSVTKKLIVQ